LITYWTFTKQYPMWALFPGLPLWGFLGAAVVPALLGESGMRFSVMFAIIGGDLLLGAIWLWSRATNASAKKTLSLTAVTLVVALAIVFSPVIERNTNLSIRSVYLAIFGGLPYAGELQINSMEGEVTITSADIGPSFIVPDRSDFVREVRNFVLHGAQGSAPEALDPYVETADNLYADVVDNEIRVYGIQEGYESVFVTVFAEIKTDPDKIELWKEMQKAKWRAFPANLIDITNIDLNRGYVTLPLIAENMTLNHYPFFEKMGHKHDMSSIAEYVHEKEGR